MWSPPAEFGPESQRRPALRQGKPVADSTSLKTRRKSLAVRPPKAQNTREMNSTQKQFSLNRGASRKQISISPPRWLFSPMVAASGFNSES